MNSTAQELLFHRIREMIPDDQSLVGSVAGLLHISPDSAYRRIRGETALVLDEVNVLCREFKLSLDALLQLNSSHIFFRDFRISRQGYEYENYLADLITRVKGLGQLKNAEIIYITKDIPLFHNFYYEPLIAFRYFFWMKTLMHRPDFAELQFDPSRVAPQVMQLSRELVQEYTAVPSTEIWNTECINTVIMQIEFYKDSGYFARASDIRDVYDSLEQTLFHLKHQVERGVKFMPGPGAEKSPIRFLYNRVALGDNTVIVIAEGEKMVYLNYNVLNYLASNNGLFVDQCWQDAKNLQKRSTLISGTSEKQRNIFFETLLSRVSERRKQYK